MTTTSTINAKPAAIPTRSRKLGEKPLSDRERMIRLHRGEGRSLITQSLAVYVHRRVLACTDSTLADQNAAADPVLRAAERVFDYVRIAAAHQTEAAAWTLLDGGWRSLDSLADIAGPLTDQDRGDLEDTDTAGESPRTRCARAARAAETGHWDDGAHPDSRGAALALLQAALQVLARSPLGTEHTGLIALSEDLNSINEPTPASH